jgi:hypothetical protein
MQVPDGILIFGVGESVYPKFTDYTFLKLIVKNRMLTENQYLEDNEVGCS